MQIQSRSLSKNKRPSGNCVRLRFSSPSSDPGHRNSLTDGGPLRLWAENWCCGRPTAWSHGNCGCVDGLCSCNFFSGSTFKYYDRIVHFDNVHQVELLFGSSGRGGLEKSVERRSCWALELGTPMRMGYDGSLHFAAAQGTTGTRAKGNSTLQHCLDWLPCMSVAHNLVEFANI